MAAPVRLAAAALTFVAIVAGIVLLDTLQRDTFEGTLLPERVDPPPPTAYPPPRQPQIA
jgi:hypothetical protein